MSDSAFPPGSDKEWDELLQQLRRHSAASPQPFFYARVRARLSAEANRPFFWLPQWVRRPAYAVLLGMLVLAVSGDAAATAPGSRIAGHSEQPVSP